MSKYNRKNKIKAVCNTSSKGATTDNYFFKSIYFNWKKQTETCQTTQHLICLGLIGNKSYF